MNERLFSLILSFIPPHLKGSASAEASAKASASASVQARAYAFASTLARMVVMMSASVSLIDCMRKSWLLMGTLSFT